MSNLLAYFCINPLIIIVARLQLFYKNPIGLKKHAAPCAPCAPKKRRRNCFLMLRLTIDSRRTDYSSNSPENSSLRRLFTTLRRLLTTLRRLLTTLRRLLTTLRRLYRNAGSLHSIVGSLHFGSVGSFGCVRCTGCSMFF